MKIKKIGIVVALFLLMVTCISCGKQGTEEVKKNVPLEVLNTVFKDCNQPESLKLEIKENLDGDNFTITSYIMGNDIYSEIVADGETVTRLIKGDEGFIYDRVSHEKEGKKKQTLKVVENPFNISNIINEKMTYYKSLVTVRQETLGDNKVIYVEYGGENDSVVEKAWYSTEYGISLKEEYLDETGKKTGDMEVVKIEEGGNYEDKFIPNKDVVWKESESTNQDTDNYLGN